MIYTDVLIAGSGITGSLIAKYLIKERISKVLTIDPSGTWGGIYFSSTRLCNIVMNRIPLFVNHDEKSIIENVLEIPLLCMDLKPTIIKEGDVGRKVLTSYAIEDFQNPWFLKWGNASCLIEGVLDNYIMIPSSKPIPSTIRALDSEKSIAILRSNAVINYKYLIWTAPLPELIKSLKRKSPSLKSLAKRLKWVNSYIVALCLEGKKPRWTLAYHGTKATRAHTFVTKFYDNYYALYIIASFSDREKPLPGFTEKLISDVKRLQIIPTPFKIRDERTFIITYSILNKIPSEDIRPLVSELESKNIMLVGRSATWKELSIGSIFHEVKKVVEKVIGFI